ncbi:DUF1330 domain-containing protein [Sinirhodobacter ferrireducens]|uniref:DUF1330 domain-containing protein n=1 Tax=Paenirhodobacter ferrireducens TaxID=1215032 RepID=A0A443LRU2_9RHOB|nr:DUF1330 domain-containing protein [Sinirhodobacter ferrireducens]RWR51839.1 DUF1330 domain-containing protein [Sinirhodobacter ferrireducens]
MAEAREAAVKGYWVAQVRVHDRAGYTAYRAAAAAPIAAAGGRLLVLGGAPEVVAGQMAPETVIVVFPSLAAARACYHGPGYQATLALRDAAATVSLAIVAGHAG